ncbi:MAG: CmcI family methyltransferase [Chloroflexota bacterium]
MLGRPFAGLLKPPVLDDIQWGTLNMTYRGVRMLKNPFDLALYTMLIGRLRPRTVIEIGTLEGGSALWFADILSAHQIAEPRVISLDIQPSATVSDERITFVQGDARALDEALDAATMGAIERPLLAIDDGSHVYEDCLASLEFFNRHLGAGDYVVVEDGNLSQFSHPAYRAVAAFLSAHPQEYEIDTELCDHFGYNVTYNPNGWLRRLQQ